MDGWCGCFSPGFEEISPQAVLLGCAETAVVVADRDPILIAGRVGELCCRYLSGG